MAYITINSASIEVSDPIKKELLDLIKTNADDHEARLISLAGGTGTIVLLNEDVHIEAALSALLVGCIYIEIAQACIVTECAIQLFEKLSATTGNLTVDVKKNTTTNPAGFTSILTMLPTFNMAVASDYQRTIGTINTGAQTLSVGNILKVDITSLPVGLKRFRLVVKGTF